MTTEELFIQISQFCNPFTLHPKYLFRGQADSSWSLEPSLTRIVNRRKLTRQQALQVEREGVQRFYISARTILPIEITISLLPKNMNIDSLGWFTVMQHYSAPTRTLDWTSSPWVALYFSCLEKEKSDGSVFIADHQKVVTDAEKASPGSTFKPLLFEPDSPDILNFMYSFNSNERIEAQQGRFSICTNPLQDHKVLLEQSGSLETISIPASLKGSIMENLNNMNINARTLFPGIDGLGKSIHEYYNHWDISSTVVS